jgi:putative oxidoreductase
MLLQTDNEFIYILLRVVAGVIIFPYGMQKLLGWFDGAGFRRSLKQTTAIGIPASIGWLIIIGESFGSIALIAGFLGRVAAAGFFIIFTGATIIHWPQGWTMNWFGKKKGEGIEYFIMLLAILLVIIIKGSGALSIDSFLSQNM